MTDTTNTDVFDAIPDTVKRDQWGRYVLENPLTGKEIGWIRATTLTKVLSDTKGLEGWKQRGLVYGLGHRPDLYARAASIASVDEKDELSAIADEAREAGLQSASANIGTALHRFTEDLERGRDITVPDEWKPDVEAYFDAFAAAGIGVLNVDGTDMIERIVVVPSAKVAGTPDRILTGPWDKPRVGDLKTGKDLKYSWLEISMQLALYSRATHFYDYASKTLKPMPEVDQDVAIVMHVPAGTGQCHLLEVDIATGWKAVQVALAVQALRKRSDLSMPYDSARAIEAVTNYVKPKAEAKPKGAAAEFACEHCEKPYRSKSGLTKHIKEVHTPEELAAHADGDPELPANGSMSAPEPELTTVGDKTVNASTGEVLSDKSKEINARLDAERDAALAKVNLRNKRIDWVKARVQYIVNEGQGKKLAGLWNEAAKDIPTFKNGGPGTDEQIDRIAGLCNLVESTHSLPFFENDPAREDNSNHNTESIAS